MPEPTYLGGDEFLDLVLDDIDRVRSQLTKLRSTVDHYCPRARRSSVIFAVELTDLALNELRIRATGERRR
jgi:hypothetical protein